MNFKEIHEENWEEIKDLFSLDCKAPHLKLYRHFEIVSREFNSDLASFLGIPAAVVYTSIYPQSYLMQVKEIDAFNFRSFLVDRNLVVIGGIGLSDFFLKNKREAQLIDKKELIHSALSFLNSFYSMHTDVVVTDPSRSFYKGFEEDLAWATLKQMENSEKVTDLRYKITDNKGVYSTMKAMEGVLRETDFVKKPIEVIKRFSKEPIIRDGMRSLEINAEKDYENFLEANCQYLRRLEDEWEYFRPQYQ